MEHIQACAAPMAAAVRKRLGPDVQIVGLSDLAWSWALANESQAQAAFSAGGVLHEYDMLIAHVNHFSSASDAAVAVARQSGKKLGWYVSGGGGYDLNFFAEMPAIRARLLMGHAAQKYKVDSFLVSTLSRFCGACVFR